MKDATKTMIRLTLDADESIRPERRRNIEAALEGTDTLPLDKIISRAEAGKLLNLTPSTIDAWVRHGILKRISHPGRERSPGFLESAVWALITEQGQ